MINKSWAAAGVSCLAIAALAAASANPATADRNRYAGEITLGYSFTDFDPQIGGGSSNTIDINSFNGSGAVMFNVEGDWFAQANFAFSSLNPDNSKTGGISLATDTWTAGGSFFWRDPSSGMLGVDVGYQAADMLISGDGFRAGVRGEWYPNDRWTLSGAAGWQQLDFHSLFRIDGWYANAGVKYYVNDKISLSVNANYYTADVDVASVNTSQWSVGLEGEYLISRETPVSLFAGFRYGDFNIDMVSNDPTQWTAYGGVKFRFGNNGAPLVGQDREGAVSPTTTGLISPFEM